MMVAGLLQLVLLLSTELHLPARGRFGSHGRVTILVEKICSSPIIALPYSVVKVHQDAGGIFCDSSLRLSKFIWASCWKNWSICSGVEGRREILRCAQNDSPPLRCRGAM